MNITVFGMGYVGCVTAACLANEGHDVTGVDLDEGKVSLINSWKSPIIEPGLDELIRKVVRAGRLRATTVASSLGDISLICVGTPSKENGSLDLSYLQRVVEQIGLLLRNAQAYHVINIRSTVIPGSVEEVLAPILETKSGKIADQDFGICMNPEFMRETTAIADFYQPPFTIIGTREKRAAAVVEKIYEKLPASIEKTSIRVAEMIKYACNSFHAVKVCFANEIGNLCKSLGIDSHQVMDVVCKDTKLNLSAYYLKPGFAFGGSCLPKDLRALLHKAKQNDLDLPMLGALLTSNRQQIENAFNLIRRTGKKQIGVLGLSFKAGTDDLRESPIVALIEVLIGKGYRVQIYDEEVSISKLSGANRRFIDQTIPHLSSLMSGAIDEVIQNSEVVVVSKRGHQFAEALKRLNGNRLIIDFVRIFADLNGNSPNYEGICW